MATRELIQGFVDQYRTLQNPATDLQGWISLKLSCSRAEADQCLRELLAWKRVEEAEAKQPRDRKILFAQPNPTREELEGRIRELESVLQSGSPPLATFLEWIADRLVQIHHESPNVDYVLALERHAEEIRAALEKNNG